MMNSHLVILKKRYLDAILAGRKTVESRFMKTDRAPYRRVSFGDRLFFKVSSGPVCAIGKVAEVEHFEKLTPEEIERIKCRYNKYILADEQYFRDKADSRFCSLMWLCDIQRIGPVMISKRDWRAWVVLSPAENFGLLERSAAFHEFPG